MNGTWVCYLPILVMFLLLLNSKKETNKFLASRIQRRNGDEAMRELAKRFIGKDVYIDTISLGAVDGIIKEVTDNALVIEKDGKESVINLDFVIRLKEYPKNKKGKRKSVVID